jgi:hypothetical protein
MCSASAPSPDPPLADLRDGAVNRVHADTFASRAWSRVYIPQWIAGESCFVWTWGLELFFLCVVAAMMGVQVSLALRVRRYAVWLERQEREKERLDKFKEKEIC